MSTPGDMRRPPNETGAGGDDVPPSGEEARAQRRATSLPAVWLVLGLLLAAAFAGLLTATSGSSGSFQAKAKPTGAPQSRPVTPLSAPPHTQTVP
jgi:uncharacterized RDD family membrane protein YckC